MVSVFVGVLAVVVVVSIDLFCQVSLLVRVCLEFWVLFGVVPAFWVLFGTLLVFVEIVRWVFV